jgi:mono/diheme cytochrome c family protein
MNISNTRNGVWFAAIVLLGATMAMAQDAPKKIKKVSVPNVSAMSGEGMFDTYCAACHGMGGKGDGPAASEFKIPPANLTLLALNNHGKYPAEHVAETIRTGPRDAKAHGSTDMPVWGTIFASMGDAAQVEQRIRNLTTYVGTLQAK